MTITYGNPSQKPVTVSCAADPRDLRPALDAVAAAIEHRRRDKPLFVLMGEGHECSTHKLLRQALMTRLLGSVSPLPLAADAQAKPVFAYGTEWDHNLLEYLLREKFKAAFENAPRGAVAAADRDGQRLLLAFRAAWESGSAPAACLSVLNFCWGHAVPFRAHDAAMLTPEGTREHLDAGDPLTRSFMGAAAKLDPTDPRGVAVRNRMIAARALAHQKETGAPVYILDCGRAHIFGHVSRSMWKPDSEYADSLAARFADAGANVLPVFITLDRRDTDRIPNGVLRTLSGGVFIDGLDSSQFTRQSPPGAEAAFCADVQRHSGDEFTFLRGRPDFAAAKAELLPWLQGVLAGMTPAP